MNLFSRIIFLWISPLYPRPDPELVLVSRKISRDFRGACLHRKGKASKSPSCWRWWPSGCRDRCPAPRLCLQQPAGLTHAELSFLLFSELPSSSEELSILQFLSSKQCFLSFSLVIFRLSQIAPGKKKKTLANRCQVSLT